VALVTELGGVGIAIQVDHLDSGQVAELAQRVGRDHGHVDVLVNDIWGAEVLKGPPATWNTPIWQHDLDVGLRILRLAIDTHLITSHHLLPLLVDRPGGLLVEITDGTAAYNADHYRISVFYDLAKVAVNRLAWHATRQLDRTPLRDKSQRSSAGVGDILDDTPVDIIGRAIPARHGFHEAISLRRRHPRIDRR
jgi:NAD(P)-dependent dehydrogenase (short-subunit alcohol dehydrogenase family)